jgi:hypothetical protein
MLQLLVAAATQREWEFHQIDIKTTYLYGELEEEVYTAIPKGLRDVPDGHVLQLVKALTRLCPWPFQKPS